MAPNNQNQLDLTRERFRAFQKNLNTKGIQLIGNGLESANIDSSTGLSQANDKLMTNMVDNCQQAGADIDEMEK